MTRTQDIEAALRTMDAAGQMSDQADDARALADLQHILASDPRLEGAPARRDLRPGIRPRHSRTVRRVALAGGLVAAATAGVLVLPSPFGGDHAYASWTPTPTGLSPARSAEAAERCREEQSDGPGEDYPQLADASVAVAERRGEWTTVILAGEGGFSALCITDDSSGLFTNGMIGSIGVAAGGLPGAREVRATELGMGTVGAAGDMSMAAGYAGTEVVGVAYHSRSHGVVTATVNAGRFALWFPGDELIDAARWGVDVEVTYGDGSHSTSTLSLSQ